MNFEVFKEDLAKIGIDLTLNQYEKFELYFNILIEENEKYNLTALTELDDVFYKHFFDSVATNEFYDFSNEKICDIGSGAGFPSIPLKIIYNDLDVTIVDSLNKRIHFLELLCSELDLKDVKLVHSRAEEFAVLHREEFDFVTARAVAAMPILSELCIPLVKVGGVFFAPKGNTGEDEHQKAKQAIKKLGCKLENFYKYELPYDFGERTCFIYRKISATPKQYPRNFGQIKKNPL